MVFSDKAHVSSPKRAIALSKAETTLLTAFTVRVGGFRGGRGKGYESRRERGGYRTHDVLSSPPLSSRLAGRKLRAFST